MKPKLSGMIDSINSTLPRIGRISTGIIVNQNGKKYPKSIDHFRIVPYFYPDIVSEITELYADSDGKVRNIPVMFIFESLLDNIDIKHIGFRTDGTILAESDGKMGIYKNGTKWEECSNEHLKQMRLKWSKQMRLYFMIRGIKKMGIFEYITKSESTINNIGGFIKSINENLGRIDRIPFILNVYMHTSKSSETGKSSVYPICNIYLDKTENSEIQDILLLDS